jgi:hypothetical protein
VTGPGILDDLTTQLGDFMELPDTLDLPRLCHVQLERKQDQPGWSARAQLARYYGQPAWEALHAWHAATGGTVDVSKPYTGSGLTPFRTISIIVSVAGLEVRLWAHVDADDPIPAWARPAEHGECLDERMVPDDEPHYRHDTIPYQENPTYGGLCRKCGASGADSYCSMPDADEKTAVA